MKKIIILLLLIFVPIKIKALDVSSRSAILMDEDSGRILYAKDIDSKRLIASTTKIMTAILAIESNKLNDKVIIKDDILKAYGSNIYISVDEEILLKDLIYGLMLRSGNDAAIAISSYVSNNIDDFVVLMNKKAKEIGMTNTYFCNPHGLDEVCENISTARDMALLTRYANKNNIYKKIVGTKRYIAKTNLKTYDWYNKNKLLTTYEYTTGGKTGFTKKARRTLVSSATKNGINLIVVTLNDPNDFTTHKKLYEYGFNNYRKYLILSKKEFGFKNNYYDNLYINSDIYYLLKKDEIDDIYVKYKLDKIEKPKDRDKVGIVEIYIGNKKIITSDIFIEVKNKRKESIFKKILNIFK
ncbi:MAG: D-alanyl-D-alanine carboxypeptidase [Bacilli bacterium]|nr:D-alanyl-D-alanine carboxypeptidase [Bacilli bacterium]